MTTDLLSGEQLWEALREEELFQSMFPEPNKEAWVALCDAIASTFAPHLSSSISAESFIKTKHAALMFLIEGEWIPRCYLHPHLPDEVDKIAARAYHVTTLEIGCMALISQANVLHDALTNHRDMLDLDEDNLRYFLKCPGGGSFSSVAMQRWEQGNMTIRDLLLIQPSLFLIPIR